MDRLEEIKERHAIHAQTMKDFDPALVAEWAHIDRGILLRRLEAAETVVETYMEWISTAKDWEPIKASVDIWQQAKAEHEKAVNDAN